MAYPEKSALKTWHLVHAAVLVSDNHKKALGEAAGLIFILVFKIMCLSCVSKFTLHRERQKFNWLFPLSLLQPQKFPLAEQIPSKCQ